MERRRDGKRPMTDGEDRHYRTALYSYVNIIQIQKRINPRILLVHSVSEDTEESSVGETLLLVTLVMGLPSL